MLQPKYQVSVEVFELVSLATLKFTFARPLENSVFVKLKSELEVYNFKVHYFTPHESNQADYQVVDIDFNINLYDLKSVITHIVELLTTEGFDSILYLISHGCEQKQTTDLNDIL